MDMNMDMGIWKFRINLHRTEAERNLLREHHILPTLSVSNCYLELLVHPTRRASLHFAETASTAIGDYFVEVHDVNTFIQLHTLSLLGNVPPSALLQITPVTKYYANKLYGKYPQLPDNSLVRNADYSNPESPVYTYWAKPKSKVSK